MYSIMICEDERIDREALRTLVQENFPRLRLLEDCADGTATLRRVPKEKPDILILDINMPGCNGIEVVRRVRQDGYTGQIMIQTAYDRFSYAQDALNYGANAFLLKPVKHAQFVRTLQDLISTLDSRPAWVPESVLGEMTEHLLPRLFAERPGGRADDELDRYLETRMASAAGTFRNAFMRCAVFWRRALRTATACCSCRTASGTGCSSRKTVYRQRKRRCRQARCARPCGACWLFWTARGSSCSAPLYAFPTA